MVPQVSSFKMFWILQIGLFQTYELQQSLTTTKSMFICLQHDYTAASKLVTAYENMPQMC